MYIVKVDYSYFTPMCVYVCIGVAIISRGVFIEPGKKPQPGERKLYGPCIHIEYIYAFFLPIYYLM